MTTLLGDKFGNHIFVTSVICVMKNLEFAVKF